MSTPSTSPSLAFVHFPGCPRPTILVACGSSRRPTEEPIDDVQRIPRAPRPFNNPSISSTPHQPPSRRQHSAQNRNLQSSPSNSSHLFNSFDGEVPEEEHTPAPEQDPPTARRPRHPRYTPFRKTPKSGDFSLGISDDDTLDVDDAVDDGFLARYRRENTGSQRSTNQYSSDSDDYPQEENIENDRANRATQKGVDRQMAANAIDAVDRLFDAINSQNVSQRRSVSKGSQERSTFESKKARGGAVDRAKWLEDVRARAATKEDRSVRNGQSYDNSNAVDVDAIEDVTGEGDEISAGLEEAEVRDHIGDEEHSNAEKDGFLGNGRPDEGTQSVHQNPFFGDGANGPSNGRVRQVHRKEPNLAGSADRSSFSTEAMFQNLMKIARRGPDGSADSARRNAAAFKSVRDLNSESDTEVETQGRMPESKRSSRSETSSHNDRPVPSNPNVSRLLGITKQIISNRNDRPSTNKTDDQNIAEGVTDEDDSEDERDNGRPVSDSRRAYKYSFVRRVGGRTCRIYTEPEEWRPLSEEEVATVRSDNRSLNGNAVRGKGVVMDCRSCRATGLEPCIACLGNGWIPVLSADNKIGDRRRTILEKMWNRPNLVVDCHGEAQCVRCNGIGKQFCSKCKGSGSATRKGFNVLDMREIFNIFPDVDETLTDEGHVDDDIEEDEDEVHNVDDVDQFQFYTGTTEAFDFNGKSSIDERENETDDDEAENDVEVVDEDMDVEDESAELLAALEAMHLADLEEGGMEYTDRIRRRRMMNDEDEVDGNDLDGEHEEENDDDLDDDENERFELFLRDGIEDEDDQDLNDFSQDLLDEEFDIYNESNESNNGVGRSLNSKSGSKKRRFASEDQD